MTARPLGFSPRALTALGTAALLAATLVGCSSDTGADSLDPAGEPTTAAAQVEPVEIGDNLASRTAVAVDKQVRITVQGGTLRRVSVASEDGTPLDGALSDEGSAWKASGRLEPGTGYVVRALAEGSDGAVERETRRFRTADLSLDDQTYASIAPLDGETVGVGMPVVVTFDVPVADRASIERHLTVSSTPRQVGSWHWLSDTEVHWRPRTYWQAGSDVTVDVDINSVPAGNGVFGQESRRIGFHVGDANVYKVSAATHSMQVFSNGDLLRTIPITTGKAGFTTRSGTKVIMEKFRERRMNSETVGISEGDPEFYDIDDVEYAMRLTYSGEFIHAAPWSVGSQGSANVSHGCTGMSTADAGWLYGLSKRGDVVEYVGTDRPMTLENGFGDWNASFADYRTGSALSS
ncbi:L,D-transpeptidase [Nocardioides donggukensis]|uniref:L,D-transpeptidase family protein n=1 Tax=Nocardioides donggukensis TaxID=2774019 RepID=A0A927PYW9_9ACTN|nr:Ig-like domain-containing protein [Nocardioides donggukensis]MBD8869128.1 L,D-transpeptidase family protein [Nocardioides donggukensis]